MNNLGYNNKTYFGSDVFVNANENISENLTVGGDLVVDGTVIIPNIEVENLDVNTIHGKDYPDNEIDLSNANSLSLRWKSANPNTYNTLTGDAFKLNLNGPTNPELNANGIQINYLNTRNDDFLYMANGDNWVSIALENGNTEITKSENTPNSYVSINGYKMPDQIGLAGQVMASDSQNVTFQSIPSYTNVTQQDVLFSLDPIDPYTQLALLLPFSGALIYNYPQNNLSSIPQNVSVNTILTFPNYQGGDSSANYIVYNPENVTNYFCYKDFTNNPNVTTPIQMLKTPSTLTYYQKVIVPILQTSPEKAYQRLYLDLAFKGLGQQVNVYVFYSNTPPNASVDNSLFTTQPGVILLDSFTPTSPYEFKYFVRKEYDLQPSALNNSNAYIVVEQQYTNDGLNPYTPGQDGLCLGRFNVYGQYVSSGFGSVVPNTTLQHNLLQNLTEDEHPQYALLAGRPGDILKIDYVKPLDNPNVDISALSINNNYAFPTVDGSNGQVLSTNGSGTLGFTSLPASSPYAGFQNCIYAESTANFGNSFGNWFDTKNFIEANTTNRCVTVFFNDLNYLPPAGLNPNSDVDGQQKLTLAPYRVDVTNRTIINLGNGLIFSNIRHIEGPMVLRTDSLATSNLDFSNGAVITLRNIIIQPTATSTQALFNIRNKTVIVQFFNVQIDRSLNPTVKLFDVDNTGACLLECFNCPPGSDVDYNNIVQGNVGSSFTINYDSTLNGSALTQTGYLGNFVASVQNISSAIYYNDSLLPNLGVDNVQSAVDNIKQKYFNQNSSQFSLFGQPLVTQQGPSGNPSGYTNFTGNVVTDAGVFVGGFGTTAYRISDIVDCLKSYGLLQQ